MASFDCNGSFKIAGSCEFLAAPQGQRVFAKVIESARCGVEFLSMRAFLSIKALLFVRYGVD